MPHTLTSRTAFMAVTSLLLTQAVAHAYTDNCKDVAERRIAVCIKSRMSKDQCVTSSYVGPDACTKDQQDQQLHSFLTTYYDQLKSGVIKPPTDPLPDTPADNPHHDDNGQPHDSSGQSNDGNGHQHDSGDQHHSGANSTPDAFDQAIIDRINNGDYSQMNSRDFWHAMQNSGITREEAMQLRHFLEASHSPLADTPNNAIANQQNTALPTGSVQKNNAVQSDEAIKKALATTPSATSENYLNSKGLSSDMLAKKLGNNASDGDITSAVVVGGHYSQPLRTARQTQPDSSSPDAQAQQPAATPFQPLKPPPQPAQPAAPAPSSNDDYRQSTAYASQANIKMSLKDYAGAITEATSAINKYPGNFGAYLIRAAAENYLNHYDEAITDASYVIKNDPQNAATAYNIRAWAFAQKGKLDEAMADANAAIQLDKTMASAYYNRALIAEKKGNYRQMLEDLRDASAIDRSYDSRFKDAFAKYKAQVPGFQYKGSAFPTDDAKAADSSDQTIPPANWSKIYILLGGLAGGVLILIQLLKSFHSKEDEQEPPPAALMNQFLLVRKVGEGGMGVVYEGYDKTLKRKVAIKKLRSDMGLSPEAKEQLLNEARTTASLRHPNIVDIYTVFEEEGDLFLVFEYVEGVTLEAKIDKEGRLSLPTSKSIFKPICRALEFAHANNIIHRDLKPGNIMISNAGVVKVMDFGVARQLDEARAFKTVSGTPAYMPPEQLKGLIKKESDIYALGICLYECLTGHVPWDLEGFDPSRNKIIPPSQVVPSLPRELDSLLENSINPNLETRIPSATKFWELLEAVPE